MGLRDMRKHPSPRTGPLRGDELRFPCHKVRSGLHFVTGEQDTTTHTPRRPGAPAPARNPGMSATPAIARHASADARVVRVILARQGQAPA